MTKKDINLHLMKTAKDLGITHLPKETIYYLWKGNYLNLTDLSRLSPYTRSSLVYRLSMMDIKQAVLGLTEVTCACGCLETFLPRTQAQKFKNENHRLNYYRSQIKKGELEPVSTFNCPVCGKLKGRYRQFGHTLVSKTCSKKCGYIYNKKNKVTSNGLKKKVLPKVKEKDRSTICYKNGIPCKHYHNWLDIDNIINEVGCECLTGYESK